MGAFATVAVVVPWAGGDTVAKVEGRTVPLYRNGGAWCCFEPEHPECEEAVSTPSTITRRFFPLKDLSSCSLKLQCGGAALFGFGADTKGGFSVLAFEEDGGAGAGALSCTPGRKCISVIACAAGFLSAAARMFLEFCCGQLRQVPKAVFVGEADAPCVADDGGAGTIAVAAAFAAAMVVAAVAAVAACAWPGAFGVSFSE